MKTSHARSIAILETTLAATTGFLAALTILWPDWIEASTGWDPDHQDGALEVLIVIGLALASVCLSLVARHGWRMVRTAGAP